LASKKQKTKNTSRFCRIEAGLREELNDPAAAALLHELKTLGLRPPERIRTCRLYWLEGNFQRAAAGRLARELFSDPVVERAAINEPLYAERGAHVIEVVRKPGVMDPAVESIRKALADRGLSAGHIATGRKYLFFYPRSANSAGKELLSAARKALANECIEEIWLDKPAPVHAVAGKAEFKLVRVPLAGKKDKELLEISRKGCLSLTLEEMRTIQAHYQTLGRDPTNIEMETLAQTWSEHCGHKTMRGAVDFTGPDGAKHYASLLKETVFRATQTINHPRCLSVFKDNAGVIAFDDKLALTFKVETHNHPSALEPYGGAGTGIGGVIRDTMGTGLGAKPIASTDIFCFGPPETPFSALPAGVLHPRRVMSGVVAGVRDYGNRMGIPTVNGAVHFDPRYVGNPLVFCGSLGLLPKDKLNKRARPGDLVVVLGGKTGRDGIHGATFSSIELCEDSEMLSSGAVQIGNAIEEKKVLDVLLQARDRGLYTCVTDCGAGGLSSAAGEMSEELGATIELDKVPLKYAGLTYTEIWISEAQERMVVSVPPEKWPELAKLCAAEGVEATALGVFGAAKDGQAALVLKYNGTVVGEIRMKFLHEGVPAVRRKAVWRPAKAEKRAAVSEDTAISGDTIPIAAQSGHVPGNFGSILRAILAHPTVASKQWIIRQYDHEVQARTALKPLAGIKDDGPADGAVLTPVLGQTRGAAAACGLCPQFTERDPREMARLAVDECIRNLVAVGADPENIFILDNFAWGNTSKPDQLGSLVLACEGAAEAAIAYGTPFISGKDSLNNEYSVGGKSIAIPGTLLISGLGLVADIRACVTPDLKQPGAALFMAGLTRNELGASHFNLLSGLSAQAGEMPRVDLKLAPKLHRAMHQAITRGLARSCHDLSEGGLAVAAAEMAFAGGLGARIEKGKLPAEEALPPQALLFSESPSRYLIEAAEGKEGELAALFAGLPLARVGEVLAKPALQCYGPKGELLLDEPVEKLKEAWLSCGH
jgi:phosphoribosylformylglycinamidine synthase